MLRDGLLQHLARASEVLELQQHDPEHGGSALRLRIGLGQQARRIQHIGGEAIVQCTDDEFIQRTRVGLVGLQVGQEHIPAPGLAPDRHRAPELVVDAHHLFGSGGGCRL
jgi:hypothetical protein